MYKKYIVRLTEEQRTQLETLVRSGRAHARKPLSGSILLKADADGPENWTDELIADTFEFSTATVARKRRRFCEECLEVALMLRKPGRPRRRVLDGRAEAHLVALCCSEPPEGRARSSLRLLADRMVELGYADEPSYEMRRRTLKKTSSNLTSNISGWRSEEERGFGVEDGRDSGIRGSGKLERRGLITVDLSRYETAIERGLFKALHELQRLQADRAPADSIPPPVAVDVDAPEIPEGISERLALFGNNRIWAL